MFERLPTVDEDCFLAVGDDFRELTPAVLKDRVEQLRQANPWLVEAIERPASSIAEGFKGDARMQVFSDITVAMLALLRLIERAMET